ncbi:MAG: F0F1 ATP synthase subunit A [Spirochaetaceae bacterium]|jgi:F-type H+-transporting ATPase subunit a|nr:F0F1 ATP synthase subunit A [Spirochaetaceae bacterium]
MSLGERIMERLNIETVFTIPVPPLHAFGHTFFEKGIPITETVVVTWAVMAMLILGSLLLTRKLKTVPKGFQVFLEALVEFKNKFSKDNFGRYASVLGDYIGALFLFLVVANILPFLSPIAVYGLEPLFEIKPPTRDINVTAAFAVISLLLMLVLGVHARGIKGWTKNLFHPVPIMLPFNLMDFITRPLSLCLRLFGNILGGFVLMGLIEIIIPVLVPMAFSLYFDFFDGFIQAMVFCFLTTIFIHEAITVE